MTKYIAMQIFPAYFYERAEIVEECGLLIYSEDKIFVQKYIAAKSYWTTAVVEDERTSPNTEGRLGIFQYQMKAAFQCFIDKQKLLLWLGTQSFSHCYDIP